MTRKDYQLIADALRDARVTGDDDVHSRAWNRGVDFAAIELSDSLHRDNPRFDRDRFFTACAWGVPTT